MDSSWDISIETEVPKDEIRISRTDLKGIITYANETFARISGYKGEDLIGKLHNILRHPDMPKRVFKKRWQTIKSGKNWNGYMKNLRKDRGFYWGYAEISGAYKDEELVDTNRCVVGYRKEKRIEMQRLNDKMRQ